MIDQIVIQTVKEMLSERNYSFDNMDDDRGEMMFVDNKDNCNKIIIFFPEETKVNIDVIKEKIYRMKNIEIKKCIIVYKESITSSAKKTIEMLSSDIELFNIEELKYNITKHYLVPKHILLTDKEKKEIKSFNKKLPSLLRSDPVSRFYNYKKGDVIKIIRDNHIICYRIVV